MKLKWQNRIVCLQDDNEIELCVEDYIEIVTIDNELIQGVINFIDTCEMGEFGVRTNTFNICVDLNEVKRINKVIKGDREWE